MHEHFILIIILLAIAIAVTAISKKISVPYPIALVIVGTIIGLVPITGLDSLKEFIAEDEVFRFTVIAIFLPTLLGEAALKLPISHLNENKKPIIALAVLGTLLSFVIIGFSANYFLGMSITVAFTFAALMSATDPVSVISIFKSIGVNKKLSTIIEGESLINDGVAVVLFNISSIYLLQYIDLGLGGLGLGLLEFVKVALGGIIVGGVLSYIFSNIIKFFDDYPLEIIISMLLFYGSYFIAEYFEVSGVIAVVTAGLVFGNYGGKIGMSPTTKLNINNFWDVLALIANSLVFLMIGLEITVIDLTINWSLVLTTIVIVLIGRFIAVYLSLAFMKNFPRAWKPILGWGGLKGSLSIALVLSLPLSFEGRDDILFLAFTVVLFSLVIQGLTIKPLIKALGVSKLSSETNDYEEIISNIHRINKAQEELKTMKKEALISNYVYKKLSDEYEQNEKETLDALENLYKNYPELEKKQLNNAKVQILYSEYEAIESLNKRHIISDYITDKQKEEIIDGIEREE